MIPGFDRSSLAPQGTCLGWEPWLLTLNAGSDLLIAAAFSAIPIIVLQFLWRRPGGKLGPLASLAAAFLLLNALNHVVAAATLWWPAYDVQAAVKLVTAGTTVVAAFLIGRDLPRALALPSLDQLGSLTIGSPPPLGSGAGSGPAPAVSDAKDELRSAMEQIQILMRELAHRSKNLLSVVQSMARQTLRHTTTKEEFEQSFMARLQGLGQAQEELVRNDWRGVEMRDLVASQLAPLTGEDRISKEGPSLFLRPEAVQHMALALHELATNALKHGALSLPEGRVSINWAIERDAEPDRAVFHFRWQERGGPPVRRPEASGFGFIVLERIVPAALSGETELHFDPSGMSWVLRAPLSALIGNGRRASSEGS